MRLTNLFRQHLTKKDTKRVLTVIPNMVHGMV